MTEENDQSIKEVELMNDEILGESIILKGTEDQGRFDGELSSKYCNKCSGEDQIITKTRNA